MPTRRLQLLLFALSFITFAWFHQGGGWNQNARFAEVRAIVEQGRFAVDDYMVYRPTQSRHLDRPRVVRGEFTFGGERHQLSWGDWQNVGTETKPDWRQMCVTGEALDPAATMVIIGEGTCTGDVGIAPDGHFHPNKPPGASLLAVPPYFVVFHIERLFGIDPDDWWVMTVNAWLCSVFTVGLASAIGVVLVLRVASQMYPGHPGAALGAALSFGFGTTFFPFGTLMFDHNVTAVLLLASFASARNGRAVSAGIWAGVAAVTNYLAAIPGAFIGVWLLCSRRPLRWDGAIRFTLGVLPCLVVLLAYNVAAFGSPLVLNTSFQNPVFKEIAPAFLGMFTAPSWFAALVITISPWRGVFMLSPVIIAAVICIFCRGKMGMPRAERTLILASAAFFFFINICFNGFHGGFAAGPRYLIPALPFVCLALTPAFVRWPRTTTVLAAVSIVQQSLLTITDALNPLGVGAHAWVDHPGEWKDKLAGNSLVWRYAWPMFSQGRAWPVIDAKFDEWLGGQRKELGKKGVPAADADAQLQKLSGETWAKVMRGDSEPLWIAAMDGPVSTNTLGLCDGTYFQTFPAHSPAATWAAFNVGELLFPASRWSLAPLLAMWIAGAFLIRRNMREV
ncbi:MAG: hypothetical protein ABIP20_17265 [Chthoniobacteraceae bacterium]